MAKKTEDKPETKAKKTTKTEAKVEPKTEPKAEVTTPLKVEITFPSILDLKQALAMDSDGNLVIAIQFKARADQYEIFRLVNLLKQPHGALYATIGTPQSAMDFHFDHKAGRVDIIQATKALPQGKAKGPTKEPTKPDKPADQVVEVVQEEGSVVKIHAVTFNHIPEEEEKPFGVCIDYVNGTGGIRTVAGRGKNATEAVLAGIAATKAFPADLKEPFEIRAALEDMNHDEPNPECFKLIRVLDVGSFEEADATAGA